MVINKVNWTKTFLTSSINSNKAKIPFHIFPIMLAIFVGLSFMSPAAYADGYPPYWDNSTVAVHYPPVDWPSDTDWESYTHQGDPIRDQRDADPSNGGRAPQNYANVSSSCTDQTLPSVAWFYDDASPYWLPQPTMFFRWRVEQIPNTYATGPVDATKEYSAIDPWKAAQWTVLMDITGDGYYDFAVHIDGASGTPDTAVDIMRSIYNTTKSQSTEIDDVNIFELAHNPTAFVLNDPAGPYHNYILNFRNGLSPTYDWPNGAAETVWDYGTTRVTDITEYNPLCIEYNVDYQIPLAMLDASSVGGPTMTADTPFCMTFVTANSNTDPLQKDVAFDGSFTFSADDCVPCGDLVTLNGGASIPQPTVDWVTADGCGPTDLTAQVRDAIDPGCVDTLTSVDFYYCYDGNADSEADECPTEPDWTPIGTATVNPDNPSEWTLTGWDTTSLINGQYLIGVRAEDDSGNVTFSHLTQAQLPAPGPGEINYPNPLPVPGIKYGIFINYCGEYVEVTKSVNSSYYAILSPVIFTITVNNQTSNVIDLNNIVDQLPPGFTYVSTDPVLTNPLPVGPPPYDPAIVPDPDGDQLTWTYPPGTTIGIGGTATLVFTANTSSITGTYTNVSSAVTSEGTITSNPVDISVGDPYLTIAKSASITFANPGDTITYTITYSNDSPVNATNVIITDTLPNGLNFVSATNGGVYDNITRTITWNLPDLASGEGPYTVSYNVTVDDTASSKPQNTACIDSDETTTACAGTVVNINTPLKIQKSIDPASQIVVAPGNNVTFRIDYENAGPVPLNGVFIEDEIPVESGFVYVSANPAPFSAPPPGGNGTVRWNIVPDPLPTLPIGSGFVTLTLQATNPYIGSNPAINTATIDSPDALAVSDSAQVGVVQGACSVPDTYHMHNINIDPGADTTPPAPTTPKEANLTAPTSTTDTIIGSPQGAVTPVEFARFYQDPPLTAGGTLADPVTVTYWAKKTQGNPTVWVELFDYDPDTGATTSLGSGTASAGGTLKQYTINFTPSGTVYEGHRLLWIFSVQGNGATIDFYYDSTTHDANSDICLDQATAILNKMVDNVTSTQGSPLVYTIDFGNPSSTNLTTAQIIDTLPDGVILSSASLNGNALTRGVDYTCTPPLPARPKVCTFPIDTSDIPFVSPPGPTGVLTSGQTGQLVINVMIETPIVFDHNPLVNVAELYTDQTTPISDTAATNVIGVPILGIKKMVSDTLLRPGDTGVIFTLDVINIGNTVQPAPYTIIDYFTYRDYLTYDATASGGVISSADGTCDTPGEACTITWSIGTNLPPGGIETRTFTLDVHSTGVPNGFTTEDDFGRVSYGGPPPITSDSSIVTVTISTNANLSITKTVSTPAPYNETICPSSCPSTIDYTLSNTPVHSGKLTILVNSSQAGVDSGTGVIIGGNLQNSTIDYSTGDLHLEFITAPDAGDTITASYNVPASLGDELVYTITVTNIGASTATNVLVTDPIPSNASYYADTLLYDSGYRTDIIDGDNAYFDALNNRVVFDIGDLDKDVSHTMNFTVTIDVPPLDGSPTTTNTATTSASNTASKQATATYDVNAAELTLTKSAPDVIPFPLTTTPGNQTNVTVVNVVNVQYISAGDIVVFENLSQWRTVTAVNAATNQITVDSPVTVRTNDNVYPTIKFRLIYTNNGSVDATNVTVTDVLSAAPEPQLNYITASPAPATAPAVDTNGTVIWDLGTVEAGETGSILLWARPTTTGTYLNKATLSSPGLDDAESNETTTIVGGIELTKSTSTPLVTNSGGTTATYTITLTNQVAQATNVTVTDNLPVGFTYSGTTGGAAGCTLPENQLPPPPDLNNPVWSGCTLNASGTLTITFDVTIDATVGAGTYQNPVSATDPSLVLSVLAFDELITTAEDVTVIVPYDLMVTKEVTDFDGSNVDYLITVTNVGTNDMSNVVINDVLPVGLVVYRDPPGYTTSQGTYDTGTGDWDVGDVNAPSVVFWPGPPSPDPITYTCIQTHTAGASNEPGGTGDWQEYWVVGGSGGLEWSSGTDYFAAGSETLTIPGTVSSLTDTIQNCAELTNPLAPAAGGDSNSANNKGCADLYPTLVTLSGFRAYENNGRVVVEWTTASEIGTAGFYLFRIDESTGEYIQINHKPLPSLLTSRIGGTYSLIDKGAFPGGTYTYLLVELEAKGTKITYGPFTVEVGGESVTSAVNTSTATELFNECTSPQCQKKKEKIEIYSDSAGNLFIANKTTGQEKKASRNTGEDLYESYTKKPREISNEKKARLKSLKDLRQATKATGKNRTGDTIKISVTVDGMYYLDATEISSLLDINSNNVKKMIKNSQLTLRNQGQDVAYLPAENNKGLYFYGKGIDSTFTNENIYWLEQGKGIQMEELKGKGPSSVGQGTFTETVHAEENIFWCPELFTDPSSDFWVWDYIIAEWAPKSYTIMAKGVAPSVAPATLTINLHGFTNYGPGLDHHAVISINGQQIGEGYFDASDPKTLVLPFDQALLLEGANTIEVSGVLDPGVIYSVFYVESFDLTYQRHYAAENDTLVFKGEGNPVVTVQGFSNPDIFVFDITDPNKPKQNEAVTIDGTQVSLTPTSPDAVYLACTSNAITTGPDIWADVPSELSSEDNWTDYLIITPGEFIDAANTFAAYRQSKGLETMVVKVEDIMDEFNNGISSPLAIRDLLTYAYSHWSKSPRYVLIAGDGSYDYKNYLGYSENIVPVLLTETPWGLYPSDNLFADVNGDHLPEMAVGRLPVLTPQELLDVLEKIKIYEISLKNRVILLADDPDIGGDFPADSDEIAGLIPLSYHVEKIYLADPDQIGIVHTKLLNEMNNGAFLLNYIGHAGYDLLAFDGLLSIDDLLSLTNMNGLPVLTAMTCMVGMYAYPGYDTLSEALVLKNDGGAIATWAPTGLSFNSMAKTLDEEFFKAAFDGNEEILGEVILNAQEGYYSKGKATYILDIFNLLGDPALKLR